MQTELRKIGFIYLLWALLVNSALGEAWSQTGALHSDQSHRVLRQAGPGGRALRGGRALDKAEVSTGFVFLNGQYVCPPYAVSVTGNELSVNGIVLPAQSFIQANQQGQFPRRRAGMPPQRLAGQLKLNLAQDALLIHLDADSAALVPGYQTLTVLDTLLSSESREEKVRALVQEDLAAFSSTQWASLVGAFETPPELMDRVVALRETLAEQQELGDKMPWYLAGSFPVMPVLGFVLAVLALGTLLSCRPPAFFSRLRQRHQRMYCRQVVYLVGLIVVLNLYDLACTLYAKGIGGFWEMNPLAGYILDVPPMVVCFKLGLTIGPAILLIIARRRKLAQMASWWGGVLYTVLILRWVTYNAMFMH